jgi:hypothetical protein
VSEQYFRAAANCLSLFLEREREFVASQSELGERIKELESEVLDLTDQLNGKNCEVRELTKEIGKWKDIVTKKNEEMEESKKKNERVGTPQDVPDRSEDDRVTFTGIPSDLSTVRLLKFLINKLICMNSIIVYEVF